jgi:predicted nucleotidyltransferase
MTNNIVHDVLVGSRLFNLHDENSDYDYQQIIVLPINYYLGIESYETSYQIQNHNHNRNLDIKVMEVRKWVSLATENKPSSLDALAILGFGDFRLRDFMSLLYFHTHQNLFEKEQKRLLHQETFGASFLKNFTHTLLRLEQAEYLLREEYLKTDFSRHRNLFGDIRSGKYSKEELNEMLRESHSAFHSAYISSNLPKYPNKEKINQKLTEFLLDNLT